MNVVASTLALKATLSNLCFKIQVYFAESHQGCRLPEYDQHPNNVVETPARMHFLIINSQAFRITVLECNNTYRRMSTAVAAMLIEIRVAIAALKLIVLLGKEGY